MNHTPKFPQRVAAKDLHLGDVVQAINYGGAFSTAVVCKTGDRIGFFRPYATCADFSMGDHVITYVGIEQWDVPADDFEFTVYHRQELK